MFPILNWNLWSCAFNRETIQYISDITWTKLRKIGFLIHSQKPTSQQSFQKMLNYIQMQREKVLEWEDHRVQKYGECQRVRKKRIKKFLRGWKPIRLICRCEFCSLVVTYSLIPHANSKHFDTISKIWLECEPCKMYFPTEKSLNSHRMSKHWSHDGQRKKKKRSADQSYR